MDQYTPDMDQEAKTRLRKMWGRKVKSVATYIKKQWDEEAMKYLKMYRHEFEGILPGRLLKADSVDSNVIYPIIKTLLPNLYFQDPKVFVKSFQEKIVVPVLDEVTNTDPNTGETSSELAQRNHPETGAPMVEEFDGPRSALIFQNALNNNITEAKIKDQVKMCIMDAQLGFYGAVKTGWDNEQGVYSMGEGAPPSSREDIPMDMAYGIRLLPWNVLPDMADFNNQEWRAVRYVVPLEKLQADKRLRNTDKLKGTAKMDQEKKQEIWSELKDDDLKFVEYFEVYAKPSASYPNGFFALVCEEVADDFLWDGEWPYTYKDFPVQFLAFNPDPAGGLPTPPMRYVAGHQKAKLNLRKVAYEWIRRTLPFVGINMAGVKDPDAMEKILQSGAIPRVVKTTQPIEKVIGSVSVNGISPDFYSFDNAINDDIGVMTGVTKGVQTGGASAIEFASAGKEATNNFNARNNEAADIVKDFLSGIIRSWAGLYQQFGSDENYTQIEGEKFPVKWSVKEIQGKFTFSIKPFSMNYEDPVVRRRQWVDLLNLLASPVVVGAIGAQGAQVDFVKIVNRILETYDERDVESFMIDEMAKPENQVAQALRENQSLSDAASGGMPAMVKVMPSDNDKVHIILHGLLGDVALEHIAEHQQSMAAKAGVGNGSPGGGNQEGLPTNGNAANQEMMKQPLNPSTANKGNAISREANKPTSTR